MGLRLTLALLAGCVLGCTTGNGPGETRDGDPMVYELQVQPIVHHECAFEGCHGREGMPLTLYALDYLRLRDPIGVVDPDLPPLDERHLSQAELDHNRRAIAGRTSRTDPYGEAIILRLIPVSEGGIPHGDTVVYEDESDPDIQAFRRFLRTVRVTE